MDHGQSHSRPFKREIAALVTDQGGQLCHAAILASEYGLPCVVGTVDATHLVHPKACSASMLTRVRSTKCVSACPPYGA